jgi:hypothetical protein
VITGKPDLPAGAAGPGFRAGILPIILTGLPLEEKWRALG